VQQLQRSRFRCHHSVAPGFRHEDVLDALADRSVAYLEGRAAAPEDPFFLYIPLSAPHTPWLPTEAFRGKSGAGYYGDFAVQVDHVLGRILDTLDRLDLSENTLVIFTSDNGAHWYSDDVERFGHAANGPWRGQKADIWEGGHRVPFVVRWPGKIPSGAVSDETTTHTDVMATLAAVTGATVPPGAGEDSFDMLPVWLGPPPPHPIRPATVHHSIDGMFAVREGPWKYIEGQGSGGFTEPARIDAGPGEPDGQLYNLEEDPGEQTNRYADQPERVEKLKTLLDRLRSEPKG
jgi:arylsulfatase A-like enzyme